LDESEEDVVTSDKDDSQGSSDTDNHEEAALPDIAGSTDTDAQDEIFELKDGDLDDSDLEEFFELEGGEEEASDSDLDDLSLPDEFEIEDADEPNVDPSDEATVEQAADNQEGANDKANEQKDDDLTLDNPDLDLAALLNDGGDSVEAGAQRVEPEDFLDVEALMDEGDDASEVDPDSQDLDLDVSLSDFTGVTDEDTVIDIDKDAGQNANLDLARAYIEMDDVDAARELLDEVIRDGNQEQKEEAESILNGIG
jgi:pilus assembly protein FimV